MRLLRPPLTASGATRPEPRRRLIQIASGALTEQWDEATLTPYAYNSTTGQWVSYDNPDSVAYKTAYVNAMGLGGAMIWSTTTTSPTGIRGSHRTLCWRKADSNSWSRFAWESILSSGTLLLLRVSLA